MYNVLTSGAFSGHFVSSAVFLRQVRTALKIEEINASLPELGQFINNNALVFCLPCRDDLVRLLLEHDAAPLLEPGDAAVQRVHALARVDRLALQEAQRRGVRRVDGLELKTEDI